MKKQLIAIALATVALPAFADTTSYSSSGAAANVAQGLKFNQVFEAAPIPTTTTLRNVPSVTTIAPQLMGAASGPCLGNSKTKSGGVSAAWAGFGGGVSAGEGESYLDWGCEQERAIRTAAAISTIPGLSDSDKREVHTTVMTIFRQMGPVMVAQGTAEAPSYATVQPKPKAAPAPAPAKTADVQPVEQQAKLPAINEQPKAANLGNCPAGMEIDSILAARGVKACYPK